MEENNNTESRIYAVHDTSGSDLDQSPYRSELGGISTILAILKCIIHCYNIKQGTIQLALDEGKIMEQARDNFPLHLTQRSFGMLVDIRAKIKLLPILVNFSWVESHQLHKNAQQPCFGKLNDKCDKMEKNYWLIREGQQNVPNQLFND